MRTLHEPTHIAPVLVTENNLGRTLEVSHVMFQESALLASDRITDRLPDIEVLLLPLELLLAPLLPLALTL